MLERTRHSTISARTGTEEAQVVEFGVLLPPLLLLRAHFVSNAALVSLQPLFTVLHSANRGLHAT